VRIET